MNKTLLGYYNQELQHIRGMAAEFAKEFPKIAGRLALDEIECSDPYVERLLEGFAFLAARVQLKLEAEFPRFTQSILSTVYPHYLAPTPSMIVAQFQPNLSERALLEGVRIPRGETLRSITGPGERTACEYRTGHEVLLYPLKIVQAEYLIRELSTLELAGNGQAALRLRLEVGCDADFGKMKMDTLRFFVRGMDEWPMRIYEQILGHGTQVVLQGQERPVAWRKILPAASIRRVGFEDAEALLPVGARSFQGYRLLHEYFAFPARFMFFEIAGLAEALADCKKRTLDLVILTNHANVEMENRVDASHFALFCTPAINLFSKRLDPILLSDKFSEFHVVADKTRPRDYEIYQLGDVTGVGLRSDDRQPFLPFYACNDFDAQAGGGAYYLTNRVPRVMSEQERERGRQTSYEDSEVFVALVDAKAAPYRSDLRQLSATALCTNRDLPLQMPVGRGKTDFLLGMSAPVEVVKCVAGPTPPKPAWMQGEIAWRGISHLALNYLSLVDVTSGGGAAALRDLLKLYGDPRDARTRKQIEGVASVSSRPIMRRVSTEGPITFARGLEVTVTLDEKAFEGTGIFLLGAVLEYFFAKYVSINSFTETVVKTTSRGEVMRWQAKIGTRHVL